MKIEPWMAEGIREIMNWYARGRTKADVERLLNDRAALPNGRGVTWIAPGFGHIGEVSDDPRLRAGYCLNGCATRSSNAGDGEAGSTVAA